MTLVVPAATSSVLASSPFSVSVLVSWITTLVPWLTARIVSWIVSWFLSRVLFLSGLLYCILFGILSWFLPGVGSLSLAFWLWSSVFLTTSSRISVFSVSVSFISWIVWIRRRWIWWSSWTWRIWTWALTSLSFVFFLGGIFLFVFFLLFGFFLGFGFIVRFSFKFGIFFERSRWRMNLFGLIFLFD